MHRAILQDCFDYWRQKRRRRRYHTRQDVTARWHDRIDKVRRANLIPTCSALEPWTGHQMVIALCRGAEELGVSYVSDGNRSHWAWSSEAKGKLGKPTDQHGGNLINRDQAERGLAMEDVLLFGQACGMSVLSFELPAADEGLFDHHVELVRAGLRMSQDGPGFLSHYVLDGSDLLRVPAAAQAIGIVQSGHGEAVMRARPAPQQLEAPTRIYKDARYYWLDLRGAQEFADAAAFYIDRFPEGGRDAPDVLPLRRENVRDDVVRLQRMELFGECGPGRLAVLLARQSEDELRRLRSRLAPLAENGTEEVRMSEPRLRRGIG
jgi:hypothetical protein